jgi:hypothetical protein
MKTQILALFLFLFPLSFVRGQDYVYVPYVEDDTYWSYVLVRQIGTADYESEYSDYQLKGDTVIGGFNYKQLLHGCSGKYIAAVREAGQKVFIKEDQHDERLLYDFTLEEGDSMEQNDSFYEVTKIDTVWVNHTQRKRFHFSDYDVWIEGIGSLTHFYPLAPFSLGYAAQGINYQKKGDQITYQTDEWYFEDNTCGTSSIRPSFPAHPYAVQIKDNRINLHLYTNEAVQITLSDMMGRVHYRSPFLLLKEVGIPSSSLAKGIYLLEVVYKDTNRSSISKIILH